MCTISSNLSSLVSKEQHFLFRTSPCIVDGNMSVDLMSEEHDIRAILGAADEIARDEATE